jgi:transcriptional regulator with XRE-family HTH domain
MKKTQNSKPPIELKKNEEFILKIFGKNLKAKRISMDYSQDTVAYISGLSRSYYAEVELGKRNISLINIVKIAVALDIELNELMYSTEFKKFFK